MRNDKSTEEFYTDGPAWPTAGPARMIRIIQ